MKKMSVSQTIKIHCFFVCLITFLLALACGYYFMQNAEKEAKLKASYTAELSISRVQAQLNKYLEVSDFLKNTIESGHEINGEEYTAWMQRIPNNSKVIKAIELAKDGVVNEIYPLEPNKNAMGIDMLTHPARKYEANLAKESGMYTIAGPYKLAQGGLGALLFDPIYTTDAAGKKTFWGFSILVIDWDKFLKEVGLERLNDAAFTYRLWKENSSEDVPVIIAQGKGELPQNPLRLACAVPNNTWYFEISPRDGWITDVQIGFTLLAAVLLALFVTIIYYQYEVKRFKEILYAKKIQRAAEEARLANEAKTRFLFNMSHDIRTPMNAILGFAHLLEKNLGDEHKCRDYLGKIKSSSNLLLTIINQILEMARIESGKATLNIGVMNMREVIGSLNNVFEEEIAQKQLQYTCDVAIRHDIVLCDQTKFEEILLNIVSNSIKYTNAGGEICVKVVEDDLVENGKAFYTLTVEDTGIGMKEDYLPHMFEEFSREHTSTETKVAGTGLGLPIVKSLVELMNGSIKVKSKYGVGTKFTIELAFPVTAARQQQAAELDEETIAKFKGKRILLAEDNALNAEIAKVLLVEAGFVVDHVENGEQCVAKVKEKPSGYYAVILMDIQMPLMDGYTATQAIRKLPQEQAQVPIIAMTANVYAEDRQKAYACGMNGFIAKPLDIQAMLKVLGEHVN